MNYGAPWIIMELHIYGGLSPLALHNVCPVVPHGISEVAGSATSLF